MPHKDSLLLQDRAIITLSGPNRKSLLQGLITNNMNKLTTETPAVYAALLSPQGKYLFDFFVAEFDDILYLDGEKTRLPDLMRRLTMYKLRADVDIADRTGDLAVISSPGAPSGAARHYLDPRLPGMGFRAIIEAPKDPAAYGDTGAYHLLRLSHGLPEGSGDFIVDKTVILEGNMEELHGVDFNKGCYVGQEVTARMKHRGSLKKRLLPVTVAGPLPEPGTEILDDADRKVGTLRAGCDGRAIGLFRLAHMRFGATYRCGAATVSPWRPAWYPSGDYNAEEPA